MLFLVRKYEPKGNKQNRNLVEEDQIRIWLKPKDYLNWESFNKALDHIFKNIGKKFTIHANQGFKIKGKNK